MKLSILIPAYNEENTIAEILEKIISLNLYNNIEKEIIVIDDFSKDKTEAIVKSFVDKYDFVFYYKQSRNRGKGAAIRRGLENVSGDFVIIQDADLEYDPKDYNPLLQTMIENDYKVIYGSRFLKKENKHSYHRFYLGGRLVSLATNILFLQNLTDEPTCYKLFRTDFIKSIPLKCEGFEFCPEITAKVAKKGIKIKEIPIQYYPRSIEEGKKIRWTDGLIAIWTLLKYRFVN